MREINRDGVKLSQLRAFVAVAEQGNFSEAALTLSISQSAVSHAIATLEAELGVVLLSRGRHGANLTPVGNRVLDHAHQMLQSLEAIGKEANLAKGLQGGQVRVASFRSVASHILPEIMAEFRRRFPAITISIAEERGYEGVEQILREGRADIGFTCLPTGNEFETWELLRDQYVVLLPPSIKIANDPITWEQLAAHPMIMPLDNDYCSIIIYDYFARMNQPIAPAYKIVEDSTIVGMVMQGLGITVMAKLAAEPMPPEIQVRQLPVPLERIVRVATLADALHPPAVFAFLDILKNSALKNSALKNHARFDQRSIVLPIPLASGRTGVTDKIADQHPVS